MPCRGNVKAWQIRKGGFKTRKSANLRKQLSCQSVFRFRSAHKPFAMALKAPPAHPPYIALIKEAIVALKERTGSSPAAIKKYIGEHHKKDLKPGWEKVLSTQLRNNVKSGKLVKVGCPPDVPRFLQVLAGCRRTCAA